MSFFRKAREKGPGERKATLIWFSGYDKPYRTFHIPMRAIYAMAGGFAFMAAFSVLLLVGVAIYHYQVSSQLEEAARLSSTIEQQKGVIDELTQKATALERENSEKKEQLGKMQSLENRLRKFFGIPASELKNKYPNQGGKGAPEAEIPSTGQLAPKSWMLGTERPESVGLADVVAQVEDQLKILSAVPTMLPVKGTRSDVYISGDYGWRTDPVNGKTRQFHEGLDICGPWKTPIVATGDGVVAGAGWDKDYGKCIRIRHANGLETFYAHLSEIDVKIGQRVKRGETIGLMGNSGRSTGTHVHYCVYKNGRIQNPNDYIWNGIDSPLAQR